ncbi:MAG: MFS transporter [Candidatus Micrarchaeota archaeon]|nr:MFS transporter [Candidatus Micrarchaeota archaeon]
MLNNIQKIYLISFFTGLTFFGAISLPFFLDWGGLNYAQIFFLEALFSISIVLFEVPTGAFADKYGRKNSMAVGFLLTALSTVALVLFPSFLTFAIVEVVWGCSFTFVSGADTALIFDMLKEMKCAKRAKEVFSKRQIAKTAATVIALPAGSFIAGQSFLPYPQILTIPFLLTCIPYALAALTVFSLPEPRRTVPQGNMLELAKKSFAIFRGNKMLRSLALDMVFISATGLFIFWFYQSVLRSFSVDIAFFGIVSAAFNIFAMALLWKLGVMEKVFGTFSPFLWLALIAMFLVTGMKIVRQPVFEHYLNFHINSSERATVLSGIAMLERLIIALLYPIVGFITDISLQMALVFLGVITVIFAVHLRSDERALEKGK